MTPSGWGGKTLGPPIRGESKPLAASAESHTGHFLAPHLKPARPKKAGIPKRIKAAAKHIAALDKYKPMPRKKRS